jgi:TRAP-type C4-dicarboxylate transport system permease small subunit
MTVRSPGQVGWGLHRLAELLAILGGVLGCLMAALVTVSVAGRYLLATPVPGDYDLVGILCGCAIFSFLPYCQLRSGNVLADFFTQGAPPRFKAALDAGGKVLFLVAASLFTWRLYYGALEMRRSAEQIAAFRFYRWWTMPFDIFCMIVLVAAILYTLVRDLASAVSSTPAPGPPRGRGSRDE